MKKKIFLVLFTLFTFVNTNAQCAMCRAVLESEDGQSTAKGVNDGIVYLMVIPYLLVGGIGLAIYMKYFRKKKA
ncbi:hypothetical protein ES711_12430 [Gelidibacter salicanalis]|uniref:Adenylosuccinate synthetase n=1 Tax=Gelidibacter salicanalis TaxID=291193 RepID=A0A5C7AFJ3_9FLAO|nr:hypothetical protein [Gelidibacter salicanalis]TXE06754.1 hypothetical protein ES711_12430 [Gelidibacter salicanalis]